MLVVVVIMLVKVSMKMMLCGLVILGRDFSCCYSG